MFEKHTPNAKTMAIFQKNEQNDGPLTTLLNECIAENQYKKTEMIDFMQYTNRCKIDSELKNLKVASQFAEYSLRLMVKELENFIEGDIRIKHTKLSRYIEKILD